jgi:hypothetical protein
MRESGRKSRGGEAAARGGTASVDLMLLLAFVILPAVVVLTPMGRKIMGLAYEMVCALIAWPFM